MGVVVTINIEKRHHHHLIIIILSSYRRVSEGVVAVGILGVEVGVVVVEMVVMGVWEGVWEVGGRGRGGGGEVGEGGGGTRRRSRSRVKQGYVLGITFSGGYLKAKIQFSSTFSTRPLMRA